MWRKADWQVNWDWKTRWLTTQRPLYSAEPVVGEPGHYLVRLRLTSQWLWSGVNMDEGENRIPRHHCFETVTIAPGSQCKRIGISVSSLQIEKLKLRLRDLLLVKLSQVLKLGGAPSHVWLQPQEAWKNSRDLGRYIEIRGIGGLVWRVCFTKKRLSSLN